MAEIETMTTITVDDLLSLGSTQESFDDKRFHIRWKLSDLIGHYGSGWDNRPFFRKIFGKEKVEYVAKKNAFANLRKHLEELSGRLSSEDKEEILEMKQYKEGKPQDIIKIEKFGDNHYRARFYVRGCPNYLEVLDVFIREEGEHFVVDRNRVTIHGDSYYKDTQKETYHEKEKAHIKVLEEIKENIKLSMSYHGMEEANRVNFVLVDKSN